MERMRVYSSSIHALEVIIFEVAATNTFLPILGPSCTCGNMCELGLPPTCDDYFIEMAVDVKESTIQIIRELELEDIKIVEKLPDIKVHTASEAQDGVA